MSRKAIGVLAVVVLIASAGLGLLPIIMSNTGFGNDMPVMQFTLLERDIFTVTHLPNGDVISSTNNLVWFVAAAAELILVLLWVTRPNARRHLDAKIITHRHS